MKNRIDTFGCLLVYLYFKENFKLVPIVLTEQIVPDGDPKTTQQIKLSGNLNNPVITCHYF